MLPRRDVAATGAADRQGHVALATQIPDDHTESGYCNLLAGFSIMAKTNSVSCTPGQTGGARNESGTRAVGNGIQRIRIRTIGSMVASARD